MVKKLFIGLVAFLSFLPVLIAQQVTDPEKNYTAFDMRSNGKIYVVVAVIVIILIGLIVYLVRLDRKITKLEKEIKQ
jgi:CcmD family protein